MGQYQFFKIDTISTF